MFNYGKFEELRASKGVTKTFIAQALGRSPTICQDWKQQKSQPSPQQLERVAHILGTTPAYLCDEEDEVSADPLDDMDMDGLLSSLREREDMRILFKLTRSATPEDVMTAVRIIEALRKSD